MSTPAFAATPLTGRELRSLRVKPTSSCALADSCIHILSRKGTKQKVHEGRIHGAADQKMDWRMGMNDQRQRSGREQSQSYSRGIPGEPGSLRGSGASLWRELQGCSSQRLVPSDLQRRGHSCQLCPGIPETEVPQTRFGKFRPNMQLDPDLFMGETTEGVAPCIKENTAAYSTTKPESRPLWKTKPTNPTSCFSFSVH